MQPIYAYPEYRITTMYAQTFSSNQPIISNLQTSGLQFSQPTEIQVSSPLSLPLECCKSDGFWALLSWAESTATYMSNAAKIFLLLNLYTNNKEES